MQPAIPLNTCCAPCLIGLGVTGREAEPVSQCLLGRGGGGGGGLQRSSEAHQLLCTSEEADETLFQGYIQVRIQTGPLSASPRSVCVLSPVGMSCLPLGTGRDSPLQCGLWHFQSREPGDTDLKAQARLCWCLSPFSTRPFALHKAQGPECPECGVTPDICVCLEAAYPGRRSLEIRTAREGRKTGVPHLDPRESLAAT